VRLERLHAGMELEAPYPVLLDQAARLSGGGAAVRIHGSERDEHVGVLRGLFGDLLTGERRVVQPGGGVHGEDDGGHAALAVMAGELVDGRRAVARLEVLRGGGEQFVVEREVPAGAVGLDVGVHVDGRDAGDVDGGFVTSGHDPSGVCVRCRARPASAVSASGSATASRLTTVCGASPSRIRFAGSSSFLPVRVYGTFASGRIRSGRWRGESRVRIVRAIVSRNASSSGPRPAVTTNRMSSPGPPAASSRCTTRLSATPSSSSTAR